jgi:hypothetical protein
MEVGRQQVEADLNPAAMGIAIQFPSARMVVISSGFQTFPHWHPGFMLT